MEAMTAELENAITVCIRQILADIKSKRAMWRPSIKDLSTKGWFDCDYDHIRAIIETSFDSNDLTIWKEATWAKGRNDAIAKFVKRQYKALKDGQLIGYISNEDIANLFNVDVKIIVSIRGDYNLPSYSELVQLRNTNIIRWIRLEFEWIEAGLIDRCLNTEELAILCGTNSNVIGSVLYDSLNLDERNFFFAHCKSVEDKPKADKRQHLGARTIRIIDDAKEMAESFLAGKINRVDSQTDLGKKHGVKRQRISDLILKHLPEYAYLWTEKRGRPTKLLIQKEEIINLAKGLSLAYRYGLIEYIPCFSDIGKVCGEKCPSSTGEIIKANLTHEELKPWENRAYQYATNRKKLEETETIVEYMVAVSTLAKHGELLYLPTYQDMADKFGKTQVHIGQIARKYLTKEQRQVWAKMKGQSRSRPQAAMKIA